LVKWRRLIDRALTQALPTPRRSPGGLSEAMRYCVFSQGKRFRPLLCLGACEAVGGEPAKALGAACALELIHTYSLVHDDLPAMDDADERRGQPSCHRRFGEATAILAGDALLTLAFDVVSRNGTPNALAIIRTLGRAGGADGLIGGQALDIQCGMRNAECGIATLEQIAERKTGALITASVTCGALAGGANGRRLAALQRYGRGIGLAFQLMDDVRDGEALALAMGREQAREEARRLIAAAVGSLRLFGARAEALRALADWLHE
jgi:geranylgeranyl pyrophosphate synthase